MPPRLLYSISHPAKSRVLTTQRARKTQYDFGGEFHPHLQRNGNAEKARLPLEVDVDSGGRNGQFLFPCNGLTAQTIPQGSGGTPSMEITLLSSQQLSWGCCLTTLTMSTNHKLTAHVADKETLLITVIVVTLSNEQNGETEGQNAPSSNSPVNSLGNSHFKRWKRIDRPWKYFRNTCQRRYICRCRVNLESVPSKLQDTGAILRQWAMQTRPLSNWVLRACAYESAKQKDIGNSCEGFRQLFGKGRLFGRPFLKTNPQELSTRCIYPENSWTTQRMCQSKKHCLSQLLPNTFSATYEEHSMNNNDPNRVPFWKPCNGKKCILFYTLDLGWDDIGIFLSNFWNLYYTCYEIIYPWTVAGLLTGAVLSKLPHPNGLGSSSTLQGARLENFLRFESFKRSWL